MPTKPGILLRILEEFCYLNDKHGYITSEDAKRRLYPLKFQKGFWAVSGWMVAIILGLLLWGSTQKTPMEPGPKQTELRTPTEQATAVDLVDKNYPLVGEREPGWDYRQSVKADLDGDGAEETIVVMARVERSPNNPRDYLWDDGQPWQVFVESPQGERTPVYSRWVQIGQLKALISEETEDGKHDLILLELVGAGISLYRVEYDGPNQVESARLAAIPIVNQAGPAPLP